MTKILKYGYQSLVYFFLYLPLIIVVIYSFNTSPRSLLWHGFSWEWYGKLLHDKNMLATTWNSIVVATLSATLATFLGTLAATALSRYRFKGRKFLLGLTFLLIVTPDIVFAIASMTLFSFLNIKLGFATLLIAHITFCFPFACILIHSRLSTVDNNIFEAAKDLGAPEITIFKRILVPLIAPGILTAWLISFTLSLDDVIISFFTTGPSYQILPLKIFSMARMGVSPEINALCTIMLAVTLFTVVSSQLIFRKK